MPTHRTTRRAARTKPKYTFSDDDDDDDWVSTRTHSTHRSPPVPSPSLPPAASHARKQSDKHIRRPRNCYIIFRSDFCKSKKMKENGVESDHRHISRIASHVWNNLSEDKKQEYQERAKVEQAEHDALYPHYVYTPQGRTKQVKRKVKRDGADDKLRCRKLAELLISGVDGEEFHQAAKGLDTGIVEVEVTQRTSKPAPKQRSRRGRRPARQPVPKPDASTEEGEKQEFSSPRASQDSGLLSPFSSPRDYSHSGSPDSHNLYGSLDTPAFSPCDSKSPEDSEASPQLATHYLPMYGFLPYPAHDSSAQQAQNPNIRSGATSNATVAVSSPQGSDPSSNAMNFSKPLSTYASQADYRGPNEMDWSLALTSFSMADPNLSERPTLSGTPLLSIGHVGDPGALAEYPLSNSVPADDSARKFRTDMEALPGQATDEPCYTDDVNFDEYLTDF